MTLFKTIQLRFQAKKLQAKISQIDGRFQLQDNTIASLVTDLVNKIDRNREANKKDWEMMVGLLNAHTGQLKSLDSFKSRMDDLEATILALQLRKPTASKPEPATTETAKEPEDIANLKESLSDYGYYVSRLTNQVLNQGKKVEQFEQDLADQKNRIVYQSKKINKLWHKMAKLNRKGKRK